MKKNIFLMTALLSMGLFQAQIQVNNGINSGITGSNVLIDGSTYFSTESGAQPNVGKGIVIPSVDLIKFEFDLTQADGVTFPTYFDGMIVYNNATGNTLTTGNRSSTSMAVTPGFYYFANPTGATAGNVTGGQWKPMGSTNTGDNLGNHLATQNLALNSNQLRLKAANDANHGLAWNSAVDGPRLWGLSGGYLGSANANNALQWDNAGKVTLPNATSRLQFANSVANRKIVLWEDAANDNQYYGMGINGSTLRYQVAGVGAAHVFYAGSSATTSNEVFRVNGDGNAIMAGETYSGVNRWFRVRGVNSGIYWENYGGGWQMTDANYMRVYGDKNVYTGGLFQAGKLGQGYVLVAPSDANHSGHILFHRADGTRNGYIGYENTNIGYTAENGAVHHFSGGNIVSENEVYAGVNNWFRVRGNSGLYWENFGGGWQMIDNAWMRTYGEKGIYSGQGTIWTSTGQLRAGNGVGFALLQPTDGAHTGHLSIHRANGVRLGYIGYDNSNLTYISENGASHVFAGGNVFMETEMYSGVNRWLRVRGSSGIYWENFGGGWNMEDTTWLRAYGGKWIYTSGVGRFDTRVETSRVQGVSDQRLKKDIVKIQAPTEKLNQLNGYTYTWRDKKDFPGQAMGEGKDTGVIAQEVEKVLPDAVLTNEKGYKSVNYNAIIPVLIEALKESNSRIKALESRIDALVKTGASGINTLKTAIPDIAVNTAQVELSKFSAVPNTDLHAKPEKTDMPKASVTTPDPLAKPAFPIADPGKYKSNFTGITETAPAFKESDVTPSAKTAAPAADPAEYKLNYTKSSEKAPSVSENTAVVK